MKNHVNKSQNPKEVQMKVKLLFYKRRLKKIGYIKRKNEFLCLQKLF